MLRAPAQDTPTPTSLLPYSISTPPPHTLPVPKQPSPGLCRGPARSTRVPGGTGTSLGGSSGEGLTTSV